MNDGLCKQSDEPDRLLSWWAARVSCRLLTIYVLGYLPIAFLFSSIKELIDHFSPLISAWLAVLMCATMFGIPFGLAICGLLGGLRNGDRETVGFAFFGFIVNGYFFRFLTEVFWWDYWTALHSRNLP